MRRWRTGLVARLRADAAAWVVFAVGIAASLAVYSYVARGVAAQQRTRFESAAGSIKDAIRDRNDAYLATLRATRALFETGREPTREEFGRFVGALELEHFYPGIQGIGYAKVIPADELRRHERSVRAEGFPAYRVWPPGPRDPYTSIVYIEPFDWRNQRAFGYDMFSEPVRREAMVRARDTGIAVSSARVELVQEAGDERQPGFLIYLAVYEATSGGSRSGHVRGYVYAPFRAGDLLGATLAPMAGSPFAVEVFDGDHVGPGDRIFSSLHDVAPDARPIVSRISVAGRLWTIRVAPARAFVQPWETVLPRGVLVVGLVVSLVLFSVTSRETRSRAAAERAGDRARFLAEAGKMLASSLEYRETLREVATLAARDLVDCCVVLLFEEDGPVRLVGHRDDDVVARDAAEALGGLVLDPEGAFGPAAAFREGAPYFVQSIDERSLERIAGAPDRLERLRQARMRSMITVPLRARDETFGAITFVSCDEVRALDVGDLAAAEDLGRLAVAAVDTARLYRRAQKAVRIRDEFLSIASHELKTPLTSLALQADSLLAGAARGQVPDAVARKAEVIRRNVDRLARLISNLLDLSRIGAGRLVLDVEEVDLAEVVREVVSRFEDEGARAGCELRVDADPSALGQWDRLRLDQVVTNLVANAIKYGPGRPITVTLHGDDDRVVLSVRDEGIGIPAEAQERIFERFERAVPSRHYGGFGLGLWIVRRVVDALGGTITVESDPGHGATFTVVLTRSSVRPEVEPQREHADPRPPAMS